MSAPFQSKGFNPYTPPGFPPYIRVGDPNLADPADVWKTDKNIPSANPLFQTGAFTPSLPSTRVSGQVPNPGEPGFTMQGPGANPASQFRPPEDTFQSRIPTRIPRPGVPDFTMQGPGAVPPGTSSKGGQFRQEFVGEGPLDMNTLMQQRTGAQGIGATDPYDPGGRRSAFGGLMAPEGVQTNSMAFPSGGQPQMSSPFSAKGSPVTAKPFTQGFPQNPNTPPPNIAALVQPGYEAYQDNGVWRQRQKSVLDPVTGQNVHQVGGIPVSQLMPRGGRMFGFNPGAMQNQINGNPFGIDQEKGGVGFNNWNQAFGDIVRRLQFGG